MVLTESTRSFQLPDTPRTRACPPSRPSKPTSRATRVTLSAKLRSWLTSPFTVLPTRRNSPRSRRSPSGSSMVWDRSPAATAVSTRPTSTVGCTRSSTRALAAASASAQTLGQLSLPADRLADPLQLPGQVQLALHHLVEHNGDLAQDAVPALRQLAAERAVADRGQRGEQLAQVIRVDRAGGGACCWATGV